MKTLALFDIDGVLANDNHRVHYAMNQQWNEYFDHDRMLADDLWQQGCAAVWDAIGAGCDIACLTGRRIDTGPVTRAWMTKHGLPISAIFMRAFTDRRILARVKCAKIALLKTRYDCVTLYEDDPYIVTQVKERFGPESAIHCTWNIKPESMIKREIHNG